MFTFSPKNKKLRRSATLALSLLFVAEASTAGGTNQCFIDASQELTVRSAVELALCNQPATREAAAQVQIAQGDVGQARAALAPQLTGTASSRRADTPIGSPTSTTQAAVSLSHVLFDFGVRQNQVDSASAGLLASQLDGSASAQQVMLEAAKRFYAYQTSVSQVQSAESTLKTAQEAERAAKARFEVGDTVRVDVLQTQASVAEARLALVQATGAQEVAKASLSQYIGAKVLQPVRVSGAPLACSVAQPLDVVQLLAQAQDSNPQLGAARQRAQAALLQAEAARKAGRPTVSVGASLGWQRQAAMSGANNSVSVTLDVPLFDGGLRRAQEQQAQARVDLAQAQLGSLNQEIELSVLQSHAQLNSSTEACQAANVFLEAAQSASEQARGRYEAGVGTLLDWLTLESKLTQARERRDAALVNLAESRNNLSRAVGALTVQSL